jgi:hypothetical protein
MLRGIASFIGMLLPSCQSTPFFIMQKILFFAWMNRLGLTFIKGAGITRIWNMFNSK